MISLGYGNHNIGRGYILSGYSGRYSMGAGYDGGYNHSSYDGGYGVMGGMSGMGGGRRCSACAPWHHTLR